jgi:uncharacterized protein YuzE
MKLNYYPETDSLYIDLLEKPSVESREISEGIVLDYDAEGNLVGIDIDNASTKVHLKELSKGFSFEIRALIGKIAIMRRRLKPAGIWPNARQGTSGE